MFVPNAVTNAGENGEKILQLHMSMAHGKSPLPEIDPQQLALPERENEAVIARASLLIGGIASLIGLGRLVRDRQSSPY